MLEEDKNAILYTPHEFENNFIYYGAITPMAKAFSYMRSHNDDDIYSWLCEHNLQYRRTGKIRTNWQIIAGREIKVFDNNPYRLDFDRPFQRLDEQDFKKYKLDKATERQITWNLVHAGIYINPEYYVIYNKLIINSQILPPI